MARQTAAERKALQSQSQEREEREKEAFSANMPLHLLEAIALAHRQGDVPVSVINDISTDGLRVEFTFKRPGYRDSFVSTLRMNSDCFELQNVFDELTLLEKATLERARIRQVGQAAYDRLSADERTALGVERPA